jgi:hypothetical protein
MLSKGANHDLQVNNVHSNYYFLCFFYFKCSMPQDTNGCTVAHVLVVFDLMKMWDMVGINFLRIKNFIKNGI